MLEKYLERKSERPGKIFPIQMEREKIGYFPLTSERGKLESLSENFGKNNALHKSNLRIVTLTYHTIFVFVLWPHRFLFLLANPEQIHVVLE